MSETEPPESLGNFRAKVSYEVVRKPAAKIVCLGDSGVGKSSIIAYLKDGYTAGDMKQKSTIGISAVGEFSLEVDGGSVRIDMWDTCGGEQFRTLTNFYFRGARGAVLVYDVTQKDTLTRLFKGYKSSNSSYVPSWLDQFLEHFKQSSSTRGDSDPPHIAVLGNKADMTSKRKVSEEEARATIDREMRSRDLDYTFYETSALTGQNLMEFAKQFASKFQRCHTPNIQTRGFAIESPRDEPPRSQSSSSQCSC